MKLRLVILIGMVLLLLAGCADESGLIYIKGGEFLHTQSNFHGKGTRVSDFYIGKHEVTQKEWQSVMGTNPSHFKGEDLPVENVNWYESIEYCNKRSELENLEPYYIIDKNTKDPANENDNDELKWTVTIQPGANGYRLPTEAEWEYAASGGRKSRHYVYSGSNRIDDVAWYWKNSGDEYLSGMWHWSAIEANNFSTKPVGGKKPNELGLYDMSGNVREWCWDWYSDVPGSGSNPIGTNRGMVRMWKGGGLIGGEQSCQVVYRSSFEADARAYDQGFRVCRSK